MERLHPFLADGTPRALLGLGGLDRGVIEIFDQIVRRVPGLAGGFAHNDVQANAKPNWVACFLGIAAHRGDLLGNLLRRFTPGEIDIGMFGRGAMAGIGGTAKIDRWVRGLHRRKNIVRFGHTQMITIEGYSLLATQDAPVDGEKFVGDRIAFVFIDMDAIGRGVIITATGDNVDHQPAIRDAVKGRRLPCRQGGRDQAGTKGDDKFHAFGHRREPSGDHPGIFTAAASGQQRASKAQRIHRTGNLFQIIKVSDAATNRGTQIVTISTAGG